MSKVAKMPETREAQARSTRLAELERKVEGAAKAVWEMAEALKEIREDELWKETHETWTTYCEDRWGIKAEWARVTISALEVRAQLADPNSSRGGPAHVKQASELARVPKEDRPKVWRDAVERAEKDGKAEPSLHRHVTPAIKEYQKEKEPPRREPTRAEKAQRAAHNLRESADRFVAEVDAFMPHLENLTEDDGQACAYTIVHAVHSVLAILREHDRLDESVVRGVMSSDAPDRREIVVT